MTGNSHSAASLWKHVDTLASALLFTTTCALFLVLLLNLILRADQTLLSRLSGGDLELLQSFVVQNL